MQQLGVTIKLQGTIWRDITKRKYLKLDRKIYHDEHMK